MSAFPNNSPGAAPIDETLPQPAEDRGGVSNGTASFRTTELDMPDFRAVALAASRASAERLDLAAARRTREQDEWNARLGEAVRVLNSQVRPLLRSAVEAFREVGAPAQIDDNFELRALPAWLCFYCEAPARTEGGLNLLGATSVKAFFAHDGKVLRGGTAKSYSTRPDVLEVTTLSASEMLRISRLVLDSYFQDLERKTAQGSP